MYAGFFPPLLKKSLRDAAEISHEALVREWAPNQWRLCFWQA